MKGLFSNGRMFFAHLVLTTITALLFVTAEQIFRITNPILTFNLTVKTFFEYFAIFFFVFALKKRRTVQRVFGFVLLLFFVQLTHFNYYGTWIFPLEYLMFFTKFRETMETFTTVLDITVIPLLLTAAVGIGTFRLLRRYDDRRLHIPWIGIVWILVLIFLPARVYVDDSDKGARPNIEVNPIRNGFETMGYLFGSILPKKISGKSNIEQPVRAAPPLTEKNPDINVVLVMGESLNRNFMSLYGYEKPTTPFLDSLRNDPDFSYKKALSVGVYTDVSLPYFFNIVPRPDGVAQILSTNTCLFRLAKENGFGTAFHSAQCRDGLSNIKSYLCTRWIDRYSDGTTETGDIKKDALDDALLKHLETADFSKPQFLVLHQVGSHSPVEWRYPPAFDRFADKYLNTVLYTDHILKRIVEILREKSPRPTYLVFTSDHSTGHGGKAGRGHGKLDFLEIMEVPFVVYGIRTNIDGIRKNYWTKTPYISHYEIASIVAGLLGYDKNALKPENADGCYVCGNDINGLAGYLKIDFSDGNVTKKFRLP